MRMASSLAVTVCPVVCAGVHNVQRQQTAVGSRVRLTSCFAQHVAARSFVGAAAAMEAAALMCGCYVSKLRTQRSVWSGWSLRFLRTSNITCRHTFPFLASATYTTRAAVDVQTLCQDILAAFTATERCLFACLWLRHYCRLVLSARQAV